ncbi:MAG: TIGR02757 family protein, partial [Chitinophagaceae bacterium]|nr:TIGR02757 family protein [Chitinophagaceae bacterium]
TDLLYFILFLKHHYSNYKSLESAFLKNASIATPVGGGLVGAALSGFHDYFFSLQDAPVRTKKHIATPVRNSTCKRLNMYLRWMVRNDNNGVDFGIWEHIKPGELICPIDVHVARVARKLQLLQRKQTDWQAALELTDNLKRFDSNDPVKYDFALFNLGIAEKF